MAGTATETIRGGNMGVWTAIGVGTGAAVGVATGDLALWSAVGIAVALPWVRSRIEAENRLFYSGRQ
ncbi:hypothetical protein ACFQL7_07435 [Halocatena marina]|uniref:Uncharacterized protein n=1 Tax=Halocatena marina TaxID=2934937 RepID=A0ABD5YTB6_9EURY